MEHYLDFDLELDRFANNFLGYGNLNAALWFIGMEEGGGVSKKEIELRLIAWRDLDFPITPDIADFHDRIGHGALFSGKVKLQKTWAKLITFQLAIGGLGYSKEELREFQKNQLGRRNSNNALIEFMPLPSPGIKKWYYNIFSSLPYLESRQIYIEAMAEKRINLIRRQLAKFKPKIVLFYGLGYLDYWNKIAEIDFKLYSEEEVYIGHKDETYFIATKHPVGFLKAGYFENIARLVTQITSLNNIE